MATAIEIALSKAHMLIKDIRMSGQKFGTSETIWRDIDRLEEALAEVDRERHEARLDTYRARARKLIVCVDPDRAYASEDFEVTDDAPVVLAKRAGDRGAWVTMRVFLKSADVGDEEEF